MNAKAPTLPLLPLKGSQDWQGEAIPDFQDFDFTAIPWVPLRQEGRRVDNMECVKASNSRRVVRISPSDSEATPQPTLYVKRYLANTLRRQIGLRLGGIRASREFHLGRSLLEAGIATPTPLAWAAHVQAYRTSHQGKPIAVPPASYLLTLEWPNQGSVRDWIVIHPQPGNGLIEGLARFIAAAHNLGFYHDDCTAEHVLVAPEKNQPDPNVLSEFALIDVDNGRMTGNPLPARLRIANLFQMLRSIPIEFLSESERVGFIEQYLGHAAEGLKMSPDACIQSIERLARRKVARSVMHQ